MVGITREGQQQERVLFVVVRGSERNARRAIRCTFEFVKSMELPAALTLWLLHKLDQMRAAQREWDNYTKESSQ